MKYILEIRDLTFRKAKAPAGALGINQRPDRPWLECAGELAGAFAFGIAQSRHREVYERSLQRMLDLCK